MEKLTEQPIKKKIRNFITLNSVTKDEIRKEYNEIFDKLKEYEDKQEWISVEDRLPETEGDYLVWNKEQNKIEIRFFYRLPPHYPVESHPEIREYFGNYADYKRITHWMPLPQPPKMKGAER